VVSGRHRIGYPVHLPRALFLAEVMATRHDLGAVTFCHEAVTVPAAGEASGRPFHQVGFFHHPRANPLLGVLGCDREVSHEAGCDRVARCGARGPCLSCGVHAAHHGSNHAGGRLETLNGIWNGIWNESALLNRSCHAPGRCDRPDYHSFW